MAKEKKVEVRDEVYEQIAADLINRGVDGDKIVRHKEGLRYEVDEDTFIIRVIKKKNEPEDAVGEYALQEDGSFRYVAYK
ncbi:MAG: hypothetical protein WCS33_00255 [Candidatus Caldatribacteriota bacterium]